MSARAAIRLLAGTAGVLLLAGAAGPGAAAVTAQDTGDVQATVRKTVLQTASATGGIITSRMYTQVSAVGQGTKTVTVPVGATSNRNLNSFGAFPMEGESIVFDLTVDGGTEERTLTDAEINPMEVSVKVMLDGEEIAPADLVGATGVLDVTYTVRNTTAVTGPVTFSDVEGTEVTEQVETADPFVGSLDVLLPQGFNEITAPGATVAGNGRNGTQLGYTFVLFPPLGSSEVTVTYQARINGGEMPPADFAFLPIVPFDNSTIAGTAEAFEGGASTGAAIFDAGTQIGDNLLRLQQGAGQLVAGLGQLAAGANQLSDGLVNTAAPGSAALADGANQVSDGLDELNSNVPALADGVEELNDGAAQLNEGAGELSAGLDQLNGSVPALASGVSQLSGGAKQVADGVAALDAGLAKLYAGVDALPQSVRAELEKPGSPYNQLLAGIDQITYGLRHPGTTDCEVALTGGTPTSCGAMDAVDTIAAALASGATDLDQLKPLFGFVNGGLTAPCAVWPPTAPTAEPPDPCGSLQQIYFGFFGPTGAQSTVNTASGALTKTADAVDAKLIPGLQQVKAGIPQLVDGIVASVRSNLLASIGTPTAGCDPIGTLRCASAALKAGSAQVAAGASQLNGSVPTLASGVSQLAAGADQLAGGTGQLAEGTEELSSNVPTLADGVEQLDEGAAQVADGADQLADGLGDAADGSGRLADGLAQAEPGGAQIEDGAGQLKEQGADELAKTGREAQLGYARDVAILQAAQQAGLEGTAIPFGNAEGVDVATTAAYQMQLAGVAADTDNNGLKFALGAVLIACACGAAYAARRKVAA